MTTFQNVSLIKYIDNWMGGSPPYPSDPPQTNTWPGTITTTTLALSDTDMVQQIHQTPDPYPPYTPYYWPAQRKLSINFTTPNDGITHTYHLAAELHVTSPTPVLGSSPYFVLDCILNHQGNVGLPDIEVKTTTYQANAITQPYMSQLLAWHTGLGEISGTIDWPLAPNTVYVFSMDLNDQLNGLTPNDHFNYSGSLSISCSDFSRGPTANTNIVQMIIEQN